MPRRNIFECPAKNVGDVRTNWHAPDTVEEWRQFGRTKADHPFTTGEASQLEAAIDHYKEQNGGHSPPTYSDPSSWSQLPLSQRIPPEIQSVIEEKNADIDKCREVWNRHRAFQREKIMEWHNTMHALKVARRQVRDLTRQLEEIEGELEEYDETYTGLEETVQEHAEWIKNMQDVFNG